LGRGLGYKHPSSQRVRLREIRTSLYGLICQVGNDKPNSRRQRNADYKMGKRRSQPSSVRGILERRAQFVAGLIGQEEADEVEGREAEAAEAETLEDTNFHDEKAQAS